MEAQEIMRPEEVMRSGHSACPGCGVAMGMRMVLRALGRPAVVVVVPSCSAVISGPFPYATLDVPMFHSAFEIAAPTAAGISRALEIQGRGDIPVLAFAGDGGTFDIGLQSLSGAADRNENFIYVCLDNEAYMNTGIQVSSATPRFAWTGTSPRGNTRRKKQIMEIMAAHRIPYAATASIGFPEDLAAKVQKAREIRGTRFIHLLSPCPTGWKTAEHLSPRVARAAVETNVFPLYEILDGIHYTLNYQSRGLPVETYLGLQGRFKHLGAEELRAIQHETDRAWEELRRRSEKQTC
ncbi:MAG: pyruvate synthase subunit beta [Deltaproteobacteria bacterium]|nr:pyruvate synthase subunit beta [Deltaproteobacteria bacterium]MBW2018107.1 pyruvate synthase subunit beta [Deltaproteobacteria bacterium]MBW2130751.1 pyruvate synthase subunit beta [Deltaproteobacteria bacterium]MBW2302330.1 pyruvate synthase subunit beta [Deltaproteobacteria bacterium]